MAMLAPDIIERISKGEQPPQLTALFGSYRPQLLFDKAIESCKRGIDP